MVTALIAVVIVIVYYIAVFPPNVYPFRKDNDSEDIQARAKFRPNPIDKYILRLAETKFPRKYDDESEGASRLEKVLIKVRLRCWQQSHPPRRIQALTDTLAVRLDYERPANHHRHLNPRLRLCPVDMWTLGIPFAGNDPATLEIHTLSLHDAAS